MRFWFLYRARGGSDNVFTPEGIDGIIETEKILFENNKYGNFCQLIYPDGNGEPYCRPPRSLTEELQGVDYYDSAQLNATLDVLYANEDDRSFFFDSNYDPVARKGRWTRSVYRMGVPLPGYKSYADNEDDQVSCFPRSRLSSLAEFVDKTPLNSVPFYSMTARRYWRLS